jgi:hypothetical protein
VDNNVLHCILKQRLKEKIINSTNPNKGDLIKFALKNKKLNLSRSKSLI